MSHILVKTPQELSDSSCESLIKEIGAILGLNYFRELRGGQYEYEYRAFNFFIGLLDKKQVEIANDIGLFRNPPIPNEYTFRLTVLGKPSRAGNRVVSKILAKLKAAGFSATEWPIAQPSASQETPPK
jgi:hypothetical protein